jgi:hypothetical protein
LIDDIKTDISLVYDQLDEFLEEGEELTKEKMVSSL